MKDDRARTALGGRPSAAVALYAGVVALLVFAAVESLLQVLHARQEVAAAARALARADSRLRSGPPASGPVVGKQPAGSPLLEGSTASIAGAELLRRVATLATNVGATIVSSQVELPSMEQKSDSVAVHASLEIDAGAFPELLYALEAGMPFLFVDDLVVHAATDPAAAEGRKLRVSLTVSGQRRSEP